MSRPRGFKHTEAHKQKISDSLKQYYIDNPKEPYSDEYKENMSEGKKVFYNTPAGLKWKKHQSDIKRGCGAHNWQPFMLHVALPEGNTEEYTFNGVSPTMDCVNKFGLANYIRDIKAGNPYTIKRKSKNHPWSKNTVLTITLIK